MATTWPQFAVNCTNCTGSASEAGDASPDCLLWGEVFHIVFCSMVIGFGLPGNSLILGVYWPKLRKTSTHILIMGLAWADLFTCLFLIYEVVSSCLVVTSGEWATKLLVLKSLKMVAVSVSIGITAAIAVDRYDCVCRGNRRFMTPKLAKVSVLISFIVSVLFQIIYILYLVDPTEGSIKIFTLTVQFVMFVVSATLIVVCYFKVFSAVRRHVKVGMLEWHHRLITSVSDNPQSNPVPNIVECQQTAVATINSVCKLVSPPQINTNTLTSQSTQPTFPVPSTSAHSRQFKAAKRPQQTETSVDVNRNIQMNQPKTAPVCQRSTCTRHLVCQRSTVTRHPVCQKSTGTTHPAQTIQGRTTSMLFLTSVIFILSWLPYWSYVGLSVSNIIGQYTSPEVAYAFKKMTIILFFNNAINPLLYGLANRRFRKDCKVVLKKFGRH